MPLIEKQAVRVSDYKYQFLLAPDKQTALDAQNFIHLDTMTLSWFDPNTAVRVFDGRNNLIGALLGCPIDHNQQKVISHNLLVSEKFDKDNVERWVEDNIYCFSGSFLFVLDSDECRRVYLDADGTLSAVWDTEKKMVAATTALLLDEDYFDRFDSELYHHLDVRKEGWFPAGLTAHFGIDRILVNHYLDLDTWKQIRHWPTKQIPITTNPTATCSRIAATTHAIVQTLCNTGTVSMTLTAGNETRLLLACCRDMTDRLEFTTVSGPTTRLDAIRAQELAKRFDLNHRLLPIREATAQEQEEWHARAGQCIGGSNMITHPTVSLMAERDYFVIGLGGEIGRAFLWQNSDCPDTEISSKMIEGRLGMPPHERVHDAISAWLPGLEGFDAFLKLDLAYLELRMGCWAYAQSYCNPNVRNISPLICRETYTNMLSLPPEMRRNNRMILDTIEQTWPDLLDIPINRYGDYRDWSNLILKVVSRPHLIAKKLRQLRAKV